MKWIGTDAAVNRTTTHVNAANISLGCQTAMSKWKFSVDYSYDSTVDDDDDGDLFTERTNAVLLELLLLVLLFFYNDAFCDWSD